MTEHPDLRIVTRPAKVISDGLCISSDAFITVKHGVRQRFIEELSEYMRLGLVTVHTARLKPKEAKP